MWCAVPSKTTPDVLRVSTMQRLETSYFCTAYLLNIELKIPSSLNAFNFSLCQLQKRENGTAAPAQILLIQVYCSNSAADEMESNGQIGEQPSMYANS